MLCTDSYNKLNEYVQDVSIAIARNDMSNGYHIGFFVKNDTKMTGNSLREGVYLFHLAWHWAVCVDSFEKKVEEKKYVAIPLNGMTDSNRKILKNKCLILMNRIQKEGGSKIAYGLGVKGGGYDPRRLEWRGGAFAPGRTCATFLIEILKLLNLILLDFSSWTFDEQNVQWSTNFMIPSLEKTFSKLNLNQTEKELLDKYLEEQKIISQQGIRYKPDEVAGAFQVSYKSWPVKKEIAQSEGSKILSSFLEHKTQSI